MLTPVQASAARAVSLATESVKRHKLEQLRRQNPSFRREYRTLGRVDGTHFMGVDAAALANPVRSLATDWHYRDEPRSREPWDTRVYSRR